jgi:hypothetical protein
MTTTAAVVVRRSFASTATPPRRQHPKGKLVTESGGELHFHYAPRTIEHRGWAPTYTDVPRPQREALTLRSGEPHPTMSFDAYLAYPDIDKSVEHTLAQLRRYAASRERVRVVMGPSEAGLWRITDAGVTSEERQPYTNAITRATVSLSLTRAVDLKLAAGPMSGGVKPPAGKAPTPAKGTPAAAPRTYLVKSGDTLIGISVRFYRTESRWRDIAKANGITDPRKLKAGSTIKLPA